MLTGSGQIDSEERRSDLEIHPLPYKEEKRDKIFSKLNFQKT